MVIETATTNKGKIASRGTTTQAISPYGNNNSPVMSEKIQVKK